MTEESLALATEHIAQTGDLSVSWDQLSPFIKRQIQLKALGYLKLERSGQIDDVASAGNWPGGEEDRTLLESILRILEQDFRDGPPHTVQRLSELTLEPMHYYTDLSKYLRALHRVVTVSSKATDYPLPGVTSDELAASSQMFNEDFGRVFPIPWLNSGHPSTESGDVANGPVSQEAMDVPLDILPPATNVHAINEPREQPLGNQIDATDPPLPVDGG